MAIDGQSGSNPSGQFFHIEKHSVLAPQGKAGGNTILKVASEAERIPGFCEHVARPESPTLVWGVSPLQAAKEAESWARSRREEYLHKPSNSKRTRRFRLDKACAVVGVISVPDTWTADARWERFVLRTLEWLRKKYGDDRLRSLILHRDEGCLHMHFWVLPMAQESLSGVHPGVEALEQLDLRAPRVIREAAYKKAMSGLLDEFFAEVADNFGLIRTSINGKRYTRSQLLRKRYLDKLRELNVQKRIAVAVEAALANVARENARSVRATGLQVHRNTFDAVADVPQNIPAPTLIPLVGLDFPISVRTRPTAIPSAGASEVPGPIRTRNRDSLEPALKIIKVPPKLEPLLKDPGIAVRSQVEMGDPLGLEQSAEQHTWLRPQGG